MNIPKLIVLSGINRGKTFELKKEETTCGRSKKCDICIPDSAVSMQHCTFKQSDNSVILCDTESSNGTRVNNIPATEQILGYMDILQIGHEELMFMWEGRSLSTDNTMMKTTTGINLEQTIIIKDMDNISPFYNRLKEKLQNKIMLSLITFLAFTVSGLLMWLGWFIFGKGII